MNFTVASSSLRNLQGTPVAGQGRQGLGQAYHIGTVSGRWYGLAECGCAAPPSIGEIVIVRTGDSGPGRVVGYFVEQGHLGLEITRVRFGDRHGCSQQVFGTEIKRMVTPTDRRIAEVVCVFAAYSCHAIHAERKTGDARYEAWQTREWAAGYVARGLPLDGAEKYFQGIMDGSVPEPEMGNSMLSVYQHRFLEAVYDLSCNWILAPVVPANAAFRRQLTIAWADKFTTIYGETAWRAGNDYLDAIEEFFADQCRFADMTGWVAKVN